MKTIFHFSNEPMLSVVKPFNPPNVMKMKTPSPVRPRGANCLVAWLLCTLLIGGLASVLQAATPPERMSFQSFLTDNTSAPLNGNKTIKFDLFPGSSTGSSVWTETLTTTVNDGHFSVILGEATPLTAAAFSGERYMQLTVEGTVLSPRLRLLTAPFAFVAAKADTVADGSIGNGALADNSVTLAKMADNAVGTAELAANSITLAKMADNSIGTTEIVTDGVGSDEIAANAVGSSEIASSAVTNVKIGVNAITQAKMADDSVGTAEIKDGAVTQAKMADNSIGTSQVKDGALTAEKLSLTGAGTKVDIGERGLGVNGASTLRTVYIDSNSIVGSNPLYNKHISFDLDGTPATWDLAIKDGGTATARSLHLFYDNQSVFDLQAAGHLHIDGALTQSSDRRLKKNIEPLEKGVLDKISKLPAVRYHLNSDSDQDTKRVGFIAQDVQKVFPELVSKPDEFLALSYGDFGVLSVAAIKELREETAGKVDGLEKQNTRLKSENAALKQQFENLLSRLQALESKVK